MLVINVSINQQQKVNLADHKRTVHEGMKKSSGQCQHQTTSKGNLNQHKRIVPEGIKFIRW